MGRAIVGQEHIIERLILGLLANGHLLVEGLPGLAKTRAVKSLAKNIEADLSRIQFTPDLLPSDVTGTEMYYQESGKGEFRFQPGPIFGNIVLADEINRAPAKVQAVLLEAMEERQVTVAGTTHKPPDLFMVMATQNPIEQEGTYPLPEAQMDRLVGFGLSLAVLAFLIKWFSRRYFSRPENVETEATFWKRFEKAPLAGDARATARTLMFWLDRRREGAGVATFQEFAEGASDPELVHEAHALGAKSYAERAAGNAWSGKALYRGIAAAAECVVEPSTRMTSCHG